MKMKKTGFTLIELLVSLTIMVIIMGLALVAFEGSRKNARDAQRKTHLEEIRSALEMCRADNGAYPGSLGTAIACGTPAQDYLNPVPVDPINASPYVYNYTYNSGNDTYQLCANQLETTGSSYCVANP